MALLPHRLVWCAPLVLVLACTSKPAAQPSSSGAVEQGEGKQGEGKAAVEPASLAGRVFLAQRVTEGGKPRALVAGSSLMISFHEGSRVGASAGCNSLGGRYTVDGGSLVISDAAITEKACRDVMDQEAWYMGFLESRLAITRNGDALVLEGGDTRIEFLDREVATPDVALEGRTWTVDTIITSQSASHAAWPRPATLVFEAGGVLVVDAGCNGGKGSYRVAGKELTFESVGLTELACADPLARELETAVVSVLSGPQPVTWEITVDRLSLRNKDGRGLALTASKG